MGSKLSDKELLEIIGRTHKEGWSTLDLSDSQLATLPPEIGHLENLTTTWLGWIEKGADPRRTFLVAMQTSHKGIHLLKIPDKNIQ